MKCKTKETTKALLDLYFDRILKNSQIVYGKRYNYLDTVGGVFNPDYTDTSDPSPCLWGTKGSGCASKVYK